MTEAATQAQLFPTPQEQLTSDDYYTPAWIFDALGLHFDLDVASPPHATNVPCDRYYTQADNGLAQPWYGRVWMNPPFSKPRPWVERWLDHANGVALLPISRAARWIDKLWDSPAKVYVINKNIKFHRPDGSTNHVWVCLWLWAIGDDNIEALQNIGRVR